MPPFATHINKSPSSPSRTICYKYHVGFSERVSIAGGHNGSNPRGVREGARLAPTSRIQRHGERHHPRRVCTSPEDDAAPLLSTWQVFAYGQTSSGKTTTIRGDAGREGLIPLCVRQVLDAVGAANRDAPSSHGWSVKMSYLEIYNETIGDLLSGCP